MYLQYMYMRAHTVHPDFKVFSVLLHILCSVLLRREYYASLSTVSVVEIVRNIFDDTLSATPNPVATRLCYGTFDAQSESSFV